MRNDVARKNKARQDADGDFGGVSTHNPDVLYLTLTGWLRCHISSCFPRLIKCLCWGQNAFLDNHHSGELCLQTVFFSIFALFSSLHFYLLYFFLLLPLLRMSLLAQRRPGVMTWKVHLFLIPYINWSIFPQKLFINPRLDNKIK